MSKASHHPAKYAFFYMLSLVALVFMSIATGAIIFQIINKYIPDVLDEYSGSFDQGGLKFGISALIIAAPIFFYIMRLIQKSLFAGFLNKDSGIRRWLTYFILFVSSIVIISWLIAIINNFLDGELTLRFFLQALTALIIAVGIFSFYLYDVKREVVEGQKDKFVTAFAYGSLAVIVIVFAAALFLVESPGQTRDKKSDSMILNDWEQISQAVNSYYSKNNKLPDSLDQVLDEYNYITKSDLINAESKEKYGYNRLEDDEYELCGKFKTSNLDKKNRRYEWQDEQWPHKAGEQCVRKNIDSNIIPKVER